MRFACFPARIEGLNQFQAFAFALGILPLNLFLIKIPGIFQHNGTQVGSRLMCIDRPPVTALHQQWQSSGMIQVSMG